MAQRLSEGQTAIVVVAKGKTVGLLFTSDTVRPAAAGAVASLIQRGLTVKVASGDRKEAVWRAAAAAGVPAADTTWGATPGMAAARLCLIQSAIFFNMFLKSCEVHTFLFQKGPIVLRIWLKFAYVL